ncbi:phosphoribosylaminoimidazole-succinocarboxamide synthase [Marinitoga hydrogenitolerans DSM 16785]|uniref:Phosphoribosylaminoimidazole-succinocarboxamide synthase n=1 Tax=Marinitoga hydrogenitolerans (strain DSM 16785 / JCM 12826 / AT1271) TaxID=1122195 RepID=A0A1M4YVE2_MARH1|nr:phosphoribosylaminoimidazolesuccinocarboxamide synthase [Marinitoga hydrogenitolerans]SHF09668.1 phosphoribosylaminoimidazole-succinocarboxamide synthase [Marinitoga hydrogenitolerans DSM 16785]
MKTNELKLLYEGKAKKIYEKSSDEVIIYFKDDVTAFNGIKKDSIIGKGKINKLITSFFFKMIEEKGIPTHFISDVDDNSFVAKKVKIIPLEVIIRNYTAGSFCKRYGIEKGIKIQKPIVEYSLKDDDLGDPMICKNVILSLKQVEEKILNRLEYYSLKINNILSSFLEEKNIILVDYKLEFGIYDNKVYLADEISPDTCRFWDKDTMESLDKDVYREDKGNLIDKYSEFLRRINI